MKRVKSNYHALHVLKTAEPKLRKALITNCNKELVNCISECLLNLLNGNLKLSFWQAAEIQFSASQCRRQARVPLGQEETHGTAWWISAAPTGRHTANDRQLNL